MPKLSQLQLWTSRTSQVVPGIVYGTTKSQVQDVPSVPGHSKVYFTLKHFCYLKLLRISCALKTSQTRSKNFFPKNKKDLGMACHTPPLKKAKKRFVLWTPIKSSDQEPQNGAIKRSRTIFTDQDSWSWSQTFLWATRMWLPLGRVI